MKASPGLCHTRSWGGVSGNLPDVYVEFESQVEGSTAGVRLHKVDTHSNGGAILCTPGRSVTTGPNIRPFADADAYVGDGGLRHDCRTGPDSDVESRYVSYDGSGFRNVGRWVGEGWCPPFNFHHLDVVEDRCGPDGQRVLDVPARELRLDQLEQLRVSVAEIQVGSGRGGLEPSDQVILGIEGSSGDVPSGTG